MTFCRHGRAMAWSLAASLAIHGIALGGLVLSARSGSPDPAGGARAPGGVASGAALSVRLLRESAAPAPAGASADASRPEARPPPAPRPPAAPLRTEGPARVASALASPPQPLPRAGAAAGGAPSQAVIDGPSHPSGPPGGPLASVDLGPGGGSEAGRLDRVARPAGSIRPHYPARARQRGEEADVVVDVWVGARGDVDRVAVSRSAGAEFDAAALAAVEEARFYPALRDGEPVPSRVALRLHFRLER